MTMNEREQLLESIKALEAQRSILGDAVVDAALRPMRQRLAELEQGQPGRTAPSTYTGERKRVTVMFADLSGFTAMSENMDSEVVRELMNDCFERLVPIIESYGGTVDKFIGDEVMALFGAPVAHENDPERALCAALEMKEALAAFNREHGLVLGIHFGINTGLVIAGDIGTRSLQSYSVIGDAVNLASRLEDASQRGQILVGEDTYRLTAPLFKFETLAPVQVKGKSKPVKVYQLIAQRTRPGTTRGLDGLGISSPIVGRDLELSSLLSCLERLLTGHGGIALISGEAGIGKSRLVAEAQRTFTILHIKAGEFRWLEGRSLSFGQTISYWPFQEILRQCLGATEADDEDAILTKLQLELAAVFPDGGSEIYPYISNLLALPIKGEFEDRVKYLDGEAIGRQVFRSMRQFFERLAQICPLVLVFEDIQWADQSSIQLLEHLMPLVDSVPIFICMISRPDFPRAVADLRETAAGKHPDRYTELMLSPLSQPNSTQLVCNMLEIEELPTALRETILHKTEGNPFFVEEVIRALIALHGIVRDPSTGRWQVTPQVEGIHVPATIQGVIMARIDRLDEDVKEVLQTASVIGRTFLYRVLRAIDQANQELDRHLSELQHLELIRERRQTPELEYIFKHALAQEATYESILIQLRRVLHAQVAECMENLFSDHLEMYYGWLAYHYSRAENWQKAQEYLFKAGDKAGLVAADAEALGHYQQAIKAYTLAFGEKWDPLERARLERKIGEAVFRRGDREQGADYLRRALAFLNIPYPESRWGVRRGIFKQLLRQVGHRLLPGVFTRAVHPSEARVEEAGLILESLGWIDYNLDLEHCLLDTVWFLNYCEHNGYGPGIIRGSSSIAIVLDIFGFIGQAGYYHRRAHMVTELVKDPLNIGVTYFGLAFHKFYLGQLDEAAYHYAHKAAKSYWKMGELWKSSVATVLTVCFDMWLGNFASGIQPCYDVIRLSQDAGEPQMGGEAMLTIGSILHRMGNMDEAAVYLQKTIDLYRDISDYAGQVEAGGELGLCYLHQGNLEEALPLLEQTYQVMTRHGLVGHQAIACLVGLAEAYLAAAEKSTPPSESWLKKASRLCNEALKQSKTCRVWLPPALHTLGTYYWLKGNSAKAKKKWHQSLETALEIGERYELARTHLEIGQRLNLQNHLEQAEALFSATGAR